MRYSTAPNGLYPAVQVFKYLAACYKTQHFSAAHCTLLACRPNYIGAFSTLHTPNCTNNNAHYTLHTEHYTLHYAQLLEQWTLHTAHGTLQCSYYKQPNRPHCALHKTHYTLCTLHSIQHTANWTQNTAHCTRNSAHYTAHCTMQKREK